MSFFSSLLGHILDFFNKMSPRRGKNYVSVDSVEFDGPFSFEGTETFFFIRDCKVRVKGVRFLESDGKEHSFVMTCVFKMGFESDGASSPNISFVQKNVPKIKKGDNLYNVAPFIHDGLYMLKGDVDGGVESLVREECDDFLRGIWRLAGMNRGIAAAADKGILAAASGDEHWGNDSEKNRPFFTATMEYC